MKLIYILRISTDTLKSRWLHAKKPYETAGSLGLRSSLDTLDHCEFRFHTFGFRMTLDSPGTRINNDRRTTGV